MNNLKFVIFLFIQLNRKRKRIGEATFGFTKFNFVQSLTSFPVCILYDSNHSDYLIKYHNRKII